MQREKSVLGAARVALCALAFSAGLSFGQGELQDELRSLVAVRKLGPARVGICLYDPRTQMTLATANADEGFIPASNMKLLTSGVALIVLGEDFAFRTQLVASGSSLVVQGDGDPALADPLLLSKMQPAMGVDDVVRTLASAVAQSNVRFTELVIDDRVFDQSLVHPDWNPENLLKAYSCEVSGLNFHTNVLSVFPRPGPQGGAPGYEVQPQAPWIRIDTSRAKTNAQAKGGVWIHREPTTNNFTMRGEVRTAAREPVNVTVHDPAMFFGEVLRSALEAQPNATTLSTRRAAQDELFNGRTIAAVTTPLSDVLERCNTDSENLYAEALIKRVGHAVTKEPGSWTNGATVMRMILSQELGPEAAAATTISDGSGLARTNSVTPRTLARWLSVMHNRSDSRTFIDSLAKPGTGTLEKRFTDRKLANQLRAKSGYINGVRSLSGYVIDPKTNQSLVFAVLFNDLPMNSSGPHAEAKKLMEDIVYLLDDHLAGKTSEARVGG